VEKQFSPIDSKGLRASYTLLAAQERDEVLRIELLANRKLPMPEIAANGRAPKAALSRTVHCHEMWQLGEHRYSASLDLNYCRFRFLAKPRRSVAQMSDVLWCQPSHVETMRTRGRAAVQRDKWRDWGGTALRFSFEICSRDVYL
jgi:hypothetical protein